MATGRIGTTPVLQVRWSKAPTNGTTSLSGLDDNSVSLVYSVGYEAVYRNGVLLSRTNDYTATDGTTVTLIDATITGDIIEIFANQTIPLSDTYSQTVSDGKFINNTLTTTTGDIIYASGANTPARLAIGTSADVLTVSGGIPAWAAPSTGALTLITTYTASAASSPISFDNCFSSSYRNYQILITGASITGDVQMKLRNGGTDRTSSVYYYGIYLMANTGTATTQNASTAGAWKLCDGSTNKYSVDLTIYAPFISGSSGPNYTALTHSRSSDRGGFNTGFYDTAASSDGFSFHHAGSFTGKISVYGIGE
jgi:hypothetical protein